MSRFKKQTVIDQLIELSDKIQTEYKFDNNNGTAQLTRSDIDRAVAYGRFREIQRICSEIENGYLGIVK